MGTGDWVLENSSLVPNYPNILGVYPRVSPVAIVGLVIGDSLIHYLFSNLKRKHCSERTLPNGNIGAMSTRGYA
ncbi:hypothetical protein [Nostoc favosum]|uniref:Uncharacterized protein n=1 Tax=Nostoc favosum CHAB5714 TaxID=2780399 RepID=A0ABS8I211_9NOSO|nr:hypothetical protein [Nostoc favosum]MCC5598225.1 hypothetical protein [Nostoc favosum CHAB5714]